jgi:hypothetical protein
MVEMRVCEQDDVDRGRIEAEIGSMLLVQLATALNRPAIDQNSPIDAFDDVAGVGHRAVGAVEGQSHLLAPLSWSEMFCQAAKLEKAERSALISINQKIDVCFASRRRANRQGWGLVAQLRHARSHQAQ